ncbi:sigma-70 family RNA polymerase sigma factor [Pedobacter gandavensis]|uniref:RNA polymerase sigma factor n=1 Tax=Pedobacter gandavensis TaxID=2679963 RepID=UPI00292CC9E9|nr:sigma-70 family RNA polymerase sigma factor [Pedobacter gandavensis]
MVPQNEFLKNINDNRGIIFKIINLYVEDEEDRKDLYQEIVFQAYKSFVNFKGSSSFSTWLYKVSLNVSMTYLSKRDKREKIRESFPEETIAPAKELSERADQLYRAIKTLNELDRGIIMLHLEGYENPEISEMVGISKTNTGVKLHRIKQQLIQILNHK